MTSSSDAANTKIRFAEDEDEDEEDYVSEEDPDFDGDDDDDDDDDDDNDKDAGHIANDDDSERQGLAKDPTGAGLAAYDSTESRSKDEVASHIEKPKTRSGKRRKTYSDNEEEMKEEGGKNKKQRNTQAKDDDMDEGEEEEALDETDFDKGDDDDNDDNDGRPAGFVRTRAMKMKMKDEEKQHRVVDADKSTIDVDAIWNKLNAPPTASPATNEPSALQKLQEESKIKDGDADTITIRRNYEFANEKFVEERTVPRHSAEAKLHLASVGEKWNDITAATEDRENAGDDGREQQQQQHQNNGQPRRRPVFQPSRFDPNPPGVIARNWTKKDNGHTRSVTTTNTGSTTPAGGRGDPSNQAPKLNTVIKSKLDWMEYVDRAGLKNDLEVHSRAKEGYLDRMEFLNRVDAKREEERRNARMKTRDL